MLPSAQEQERWFAPFRDPCRAAVITPVIRSAIADFFVATTEADYEGCRQFLHRVDAALGGELYSAAEREQIDAASPEEIAGFTMSDDLWRLSWRAMMVARHAQIFDGVPVPPLLAPEPALPCSPQVKH